MATMQDIADLAGVSKSTVSRALREDPTLTIQDTTREKIRDCAISLGYQIKKEKVMRSFGMIAVIHKDTHFLNQLDNSFYFSVRSAMEQYCLDQRYQIAFFPISYLRDVPREICGAVVMGNFTYEQQKKIDAALRGIPKAFIGKVNYFPERMDWIRYDVKSCVYLAMDYLKENHIRSILYLGGKDVEGTPEIYNKRYHFRNYLKENPQIDCMGEIESIHGADSGYHMMGEWLRENPRKLPDALFVSNDPIAFGALQALYEFGIPVPQKISVISINGDGPSETSVPPLTTVDVHTSQMGKEAIKCILEQLSDRRKVMKEVSFQPEILMRKSVREGKSKVFG